MKNQLIIFSKNRACQLHLLLESIEKNSNGVFDVIYVIHTYTTKEYLDGYSKLYNEFPNVSFITEDDFYSTTLETIDPTFEFVTFMVDDNIFYRKLERSQEEILSSFNDVNNPITCFSLRLGLNCNYSHPANLSYQINDFKELNDFINVDIYKQKGDFAYPLSVDAHIFKTEFITNIIKVIGEFTNPNTFESKLQLLMGRIHGGMSFLKESVVVGVPVNIVNTTHTNRNGLQFYFSENDLNIRYNNGETIDMNQMDYSGINGPHKEMEYKFK